MPSEQTNREGLTFEEFLNASWPALRVSHGTYRARTRTRCSYRNDGIYYGITSTVPPGQWHNIYHSKTRDPYMVLKRAWNKGEDPTEWKVWAEGRRG